uniref:Carbohydrate sulfotransferase n=2 Tax=Latimeria chalumnae TaxID=7897 RepID=H3AUI8_LATCH
MNKSKFFQILVIMGSIFMILLIILYWDDVGAAHYYLHTTVSKPQSSRLLNSHTPTNQKLYESKEVEMIKQIIGLLSTHKSYSSEDSEKQNLQELNGLISINHEETARGYDWTTHSTHINLDLAKVQAERRRVLQDVCTNSSFQFLGKKRLFDDIPNKELDHLIVDDRHGIIYCYVPKVACTNWKRIMIVLSESLLNQGAPYQDPLDIPRDQVHNSSAHFTFNKFWRRYGKFSKHLMKIKLKKYTKFIFVRDPFVRLISAFRSKFELENDDFYRRFAVVMLKLYSNFTEPPESVSEAFASGIKPTFLNFVQYLLDPRTEKNVPFNEHWRQVHRLCHPCQINYDFIGKLESLDEDAEYLLRLLDMEKILHFPPSYRNRTASSWEMDWFADIPLEWRKKLYRLYEADFTLFGYPKPEHLLNN